MSRSRPSFNAESQPEIETFSPTVLSPPFQSPVREEEDTYPSQLQPRSFEKMQDSMLSDSSAASGIVDQISLLPDEIVCVGLSMQQEQIWRAKIIHALFYTEDVLPPTGQPAAYSSDTIGETEEGSDRLEVSQALDSRSTSRQSCLYSTTPTPQRPALGFESRFTPARSFSASTQDSNSQALFTATADAAYPVRCLELSPI